jgi:ketosteroid isomerase-like protein
MPRTTTTVDPLETYRARMWTWKTRHAGDLSASYAVISKMGLPISATEEEVQAAKDLDRAMAVMVDDLALIKPPPELAAAHDQYLASLRAMTEGVHDLATALEDQKAMRATAAIVAIATAWEEGTPARATLEQALGFSLSSAN